MSNDVHPGDIWAGIVRDSTDSLTTIKIEKVCGDSAGGCPQSHYGRHAHVVTVTKDGRGIRKRTIQLRRFRDPEGRTYSVQRVRNFGGKGGYYLIERQAAER